MRKTSLLILTLLSVTAYSQQISISGKVIDTSENRSLENAVVSIIHPGDSILVRFARTQKDGSFALSNIPNKPFILLVTFPGYADYADQVKDSNNTKIDLGLIPLTKKSQLLEAVIVRRQLAAIKMKGDTLAYTADSFMVRQGATVDELLKQLPGITVDRNGQITAQGQKVNKVLVDGEEFFSDDPAVVIKNLQADAVKEVQVFDKKSEQAEFTGIDDGERSKTINLTLKPDKKKGYFAKVNANGGTKGSFDNDVMANSFKGTRKVAMFGIMSNTGRQGLNWQDNDRFGGGLDVQFNEDEGYFMVNDYENEFNQASNNQDGLPAAWSGGFHFSDKWNADKSKMNTNYRFLKKNLDGESTTTSQYILPDTQYFSNEFRKSFNSKTGHQAKGVYEVAFDSLSSLKLTVTGRWTTNENASRIESEAKNADSATVNESQRLLRSVTDNDLYSTNLVWRRKFKKKGRTLSAKFNQQFGNDRLTGFIESGTNYFNEAGQLYKEEQIDQKKNNTYNTYTANGSVVYTEPLSKTLFLSAIYGLILSNTEAKRQSFNKGGEEYDKLDSAFSNDFRFKYAIHTSGADLKFNNKKVTVLLGSGLNFASFRQKDIERDTTFNYSHVNYYPKFLFKYSPSQFRNFSIRYNGRNNPPTMEQLQPVRENTDPLNIQLGNPSLRQEFVHDMNVGFGEYKVVAERGTFLYLYSTVTRNAISNSTTVDEGGKTTFQPINVKGNYTAGTYAETYGKIKKIGVTVGVNVSVNKNHITNRLNGFENVNDFDNYTFGTWFRKNKNDKYSFSASPKITFTNSKSSLRPDVKTKFFTSETELSAWSKLPWKLEIWSAAYINVRQKTDVFDVNRNAVKWDANIVRKFLKNNNLEIKLAVFDILDQNIGFRRTATSNIVTENNFLTLRRLWMIGVQYSITKNPGK
jgi:hypothetical protein